MSACTAAQLHALADAIEHAAGLGGWLGEDGVWQALSSAERAQWARKAAAIREAAYQAEAREGAV